MANLLVIRGQITAALSNALTSGEHGLKVVPGLIKRALESHAWEEHIVEETGERIPGFVSFAAYVEAGKPKGLGADLPLLWRIAAGDPALTDLLNEAVDPTRGYIMLITL